MLCGIYTAWPLTFRWPEVSILDGPIHVCSAFCFYIWNNALSKASPQEIASSMHIKTPTAVLIGVFVANEEFTATVIIGTALVMFGIWLSQQKKIWGLE